MAKALWREEMVYAKYMLDSVIRYSYLQKMIEWHIGTKQEWSVNPNKYGREFKRYLDAETMKEIEATFTGAGIEDNWMALLNMADLFRQLSIRVGNSLGYPYPGSIEKNTREYMLKIKNLNRGKDDFS